MSITKTNSTKHWAPIYRKCKNCKNAIYVKEEGEIYYQCSMFGSFKKDCDLEVPKRRLPKPEEIKGE